MIDKKTIINKGRSAALYTIPLRGLHQLASILTSIVLIRILSKNDYGIYNLLYSSIAIITMTSSFGLGNVLQRYLPEYYARKDFSRARKLFSWTLIARFLLSVAILSIILIFWEKLAPHLKIARYRSYFILFIFIILLHQEWGLISTCLGSAYLHKHLQAMGISFTATKLIGYIIAYYFGISLKLIILSDLCAYLLLIVCLMWVYYKCYPKNHGPKEFHKDELKRIMRYGAFYSLNDVGVKILGVDIDNFFIAYFLDPIAVGIYAFCTRVSSIVIRVLPMTFFQDVLRPLVFGLGHDAATDQVRKASVLLLKYQYMFAVPLFFSIWAIAPEFITLFFGAKYKPYANILVIVLGFKVLGSFTIPIGLIAQLKEQAGIILISKIFIIYNLISAFVLIPIFGIIGAAVATGTANLFKDIFIWWFVKYTTPFKTFIQFFAKSCVYWGLAAILIFALKQLIPSTMVGLIVSGLLLPVQYLVYLKLNLFEEQELIIIRKIFEPYRNSRIIQWIIEHNCKTNKFFQYNRE